MQYHHIGYGMKGCYRVANSGHLCTMISKDAQHRFDILTFHERHGQAATLDAFGISVRTLYRWRRTYNTQIPHHGLALNTPVHYRIDTQPECQRYWTHTAPCHDSHCLCIVACL